MPTQMILVLVVLLAVQGQLLGTVRHVHMLDASGEDTAWEVLHVRGSEGSKRGVVRCARAGEDSGSGYWVDDGGEAHWVLFSRQHGWHGGQECTVDMDVPHVVQMQMHPVHKQHRHDMTKSHALLRIRDVIRDHHESKQEPSVFLDLGTEEEQREQTRELVRISSRIQNHVSGKAHMSNKLIWELVIKPLLAMFSQIFKKVAAEYLKTMLKTFLSEYLVQLLTMTSPIANPVDKLQFAQVPNMPTNKMQLLVEVESTMINSPLVRSTKDKIETMLLSSLEEQLELLLEPSIGKAVSDQMRIELRRTLTTKITREFIPQASHALSTSFFEAVEHEFATEVHNKAVDEISTNVMDYLAHTLTHVLSESISRTPEEDHICDRNTKECRSYAEVHRNKAEYRKEAITYFTEHVKKHYAQS